MYNWEEYTENKVVNLIYERTKKHINEIPNLKAISKSVTYRNPFWNCLKAKEISLERLILPDLIFVYEIPEDIHSEYIDKYFIVALEFKWFKKGKSGRYLSNKFSKAFREIGQPYANYIYGYDSVCLIHIFSKTVEDDILKKGYLNYDIPSIGKTLEFLKLPIAYISLSLRDATTFRIYYPDKIGKVKGHSNLINYIYEKSKKSRNPIFTQKHKNRKYKVLLERRECLKEALNIKNYK